jgi:hypothetical protein
MIAAKSTTAALTTVNAVRLKMVVAPTAAK